MPDPRLEKSAQALSCYRMRFRAETFVSVNVALVRMVLPDIFFTIISVSANVSP
jgi:hypothetical protein